MPKMIKVTHLYQRGSLKDSFFVNFYIKIMPNQLLKYLKIFATKLFQCRFCICLLNKLKYYIITFCYCTFHCQLTAISRMSEKQANFKLNLISNYRVSCASLSRLLTSPRNKSKLVWINAAQKLKGRSKSKSKIKSPKNEVQNQKTNQDQRQLFKTAINLSLQNLEYNQASDPHLIKYFINAERIATLYQTGKIAQDAQYALETQSNNLECLIKDSNVDFFQKVPQDTAYDAQQKKYALPEEIQKFKLSSLQAYRKDNSYLRNLNYKTILKKRQQIFLDEKMTINQEIRSSNQNNQKQNEISLKKTCNLRENKKNAVNLKSAEFTHQNPFQISKIPFDSLYPSKLMQKKSFVIKNKNSNRDIPKAEKDQRFLYAKKNNQNVEPESVFFRKMKSTANRIDKKINVLLKLGVKFNRP